jgi:CheY-like chemotaxis protein
LRNFVSNALKFTEKGEVRVSAKLAKGNQVVFCVKDTGVGIGPQHHLTVFQEFSQVDNPLQSRAKGTGLGLPLSKKLAELLGGSVYLESELGVGSSFFLSLPLSASDASVKHDPKRADSTSRTVLVIDDDSTFRYVFRQTLADTGYKIEEAVDGVEGLEKLNRFRPNVIFLDLYMPRLDGYSVLQEIARANDEYKPRVIVVTSSVLGPIERARLSSADAILSKANLSRKEIMPLLSSVESAA